jgi:2-desacetyl-2-hydroxyethyl bacteriochlorophyllide A dehydrogenase
MRRVHVTADGTLQVEAVGIPDPAEGEALLELESAGICGSDLHAVRGHHPFVELPFNPGHEVVGRVLQSRSELVSTGERVVIEPTLPCGECKMCRTDRGNICPYRGFFGSNQPQGGMADFMTIRADRLHLIPDDLPPEAAAMIEPLATPVHALRLVGGVEGRTVAVLGAGSIGLTTLIAAREAGARTVAVTDVNERKLAQARRLGADHTVSATESDYPRTVAKLVGETVDVVIDCVSIESTVSAAITMVDRGGTVVHLGVPPGPMTVDLPYIQENQIRLQGSTVYTGDDFRAAIAIAARRSPDLAGLVSAMVDLDHVAEGFELARRPDTIKVLVVRQADHGFTAPIR